MSLLTIRPEGWECPWCGPSGLPFDTTITPELRLCPPCHKASLWTDEDEARACEEREAARKAALETDPHTISLRQILANFATEMHARWRGCEFGKGIIGNSILGAMEAHGLDRHAELERVMHLLPASMKGRR